MSPRTIDELRLETDTKDKIVSLDKFPPTSSVVREHLKRGFFIIRKAVILLSTNASVLNPSHYGWFIKNDKLLPCKGLKHFPEELVAVCGCKGKCKGRCKCFEAGQKCVIYCHKKENQNNYKCTNY